MAPSLRHRKLISPSPTTNTTTFYSLCVFECDPIQNPTHLCSHDCTLFCPSYCLPTPTPSPTPSPATSPQPHPFPPPSDHHHHHPLSLPIKLSLIFLFITLIYTLYKVYTICHRSRRNRTDHTTPSPENQEINDHYGYTDGLVVDHPIWYIRTTGLQLSEINSLKVVNFSKLDGATVDGTDCSVCLTEFEEGDVLRLLPNCNHAFHVQCIDTWLRSHTNCPLCRAVIVNNSVEGTSSEEGHNVGIGFTGEVNLGVLVSDPGEASGSSGIRIGETDEDGGSLKVEG